MLSMCRMSCIHEVDNTHVGLGGMFSMQPTRILLEGGRLSDEGEFEWIEDSLTEGRLAGTTWAGTQAEAVQRARQLNPDAAVHVERVRHTTIGKPDKWRKP